MRANPHVRMKDKSERADHSSNNKDKPNRAEPNRKKALYLSDNVFSSKVLIGDTIFTSPTGHGTAILRGHPNHAKV